MSRQAPAEGEWIGSVWLNAVSGQLHVLVRFSWSRAAQCYLVVLRSPNGCLTYIHPHVLAKDSPYNNWYFQPHHRAVVEEHCPTCGQRKARRD